MELQKKPIDVFYSHDSKLFEEVKTNTLNSSKNYNIDLSIFKINDQILLFNNFICINKNKDKNIRKI